METANHLIQVVWKRTIDTKDLWLSIDIYLLKVQYGKKEGWMTAWCESGKDIHILVNSERENRLQKINQYYTRTNRLSYFKLSNYEKFDFYFPASTSELKAKKHFQKMAEAAPTTQFINQ